ncbi:MAG: peptidase S41 [Gemmatales bacterium]|nr:MAG: peptidase S41 [Gemmatales bacterium]
MSRSNLGWLLGIIGVSLLGITVSLSAPSREKDVDYEMVSLFVEVLDEVDSRYVRDLDADAKRKLVEDMINGGLSRLDPHSSYINPKRLQQFRKESKGKFGGVGIQITVDRQTNQLIVISPIVGTPAYNAGVMADDIIVKIDGKSTENMPLEEAVDRITGDPGEPVVLTVLHPGAKEPVDLKMKRAIVRVPSCLGDFRKPDNTWDFMYDKENKIGYIRLVAFNEPTAQELKDTIVELEKQGVRGLILDLRNNPGGMLETACDVADLFLSGGRIVSTRGRNHDEKTYVAKAPGTLLQPSEKYPMAVLINRYSASASEIVAAALQDHKRAVIIGERSYGKGSVQNVIPLKSGALKLTTASFWRPSGKNIHRFPDAKETDEWGVKPNEGFEIKLTPQERLDYLIYRRERDIIHGKNSGNHKTQPPKQDNQKQDDQPPNAKEKEKAKPFVDRVLQKAVEHIRNEISRIAGR